MKNKYVRFFFCAFLVFSFGQAYAKDIQVSYKFDMSQINTAKDCLSNSPCRVWDSSLWEMREPSFPVVPVKVARIVIPLGENIQSVQLIFPDASTISYDPEIVGSFRPFSKPDYVMPLTKFYRGEEFPSDWMGASSQLNFRGYTILQVPIYPFRIIQKGYAAYITEASLIVKTSKDESYREKELFRGIARDESDAMILTDNAEHPGGNYRNVANGYLVVGPKNIIGDVNTTSLKPMLDEKKSRGFTIEMKAIEDIGSDPEKIRAFIKERYKAGYIDYVLLVGTHDLVPWKKIRTGLNDDGDPVPSENYYGCLDGDFSSIESYDWACEVAIGRVGVTSKEELTAWTEKHMKLLKLIKEGQTKEVFNFGEAMQAGTYTGRLLDFLETGNDGSSDTHKPPATVGFPSGTNFTKLYDTDEHEVSSEEFLEAFNAGDFHVLNHLGHANGRYVFRLFMHDITSLPSRPGFYYSQGCYANEPEIDNVTIQIVRMPGQGPAAMISNSRYGFYEPGNTGEGPSNVLHRAFWHMRFGAGIKTVGFMNAKAKELVRSVTDNSYMIYVMLESSLIGDPELDLGI